MNEFDCKRDCPVPGACCRGFEVNMPAEISDKEVERRLREVYGMGQMKMIARSRIGTPILACSWLDTKTGLCIDYENRPDMCRKFEPISESLCAAYCGPKSEFAHDVLQKVQKHHAGEAARL